MENVLRDLRDEYIKEKYDNGFVSFFDRVKDEMCQNECITRKIQRLSKSNLCQGEYVFLEEVTDFLTGKKDNLADFTYLLSDDNTVNAADLLKKDRNEITYTRHQDDLITLRKMLAKIGVIKTLVILEVIKYISTRKVIK